MTDAEKDTEVAKVVFASAEWIDIARVILEELVAAHGEEGKSFSVCEAFTNAPAEITGPDSTTAAWHFRIEGKTVSVAEGEIDGVDMPISADYQTVLPRVRLVYTQEMIDQARQNAPKTDDQSPSLPTYLVELHNRLAIVTA